MKKRSFSFDGNIIEVPQARLAPVGERPLVSVVMTAFQRSHQLWNTLDSLRNQTHDNIELIVVEADYDGGLTQRVCQDFGASYLRRMNKSDRRTSVTNNIGIRAAKGEVILLQCAECKHESRNSIEKMIAPIVSDPSVCTFPMVRDLDANGNISGWKFHPQSHQNIFISFMQAFARESVMAIGGFDETYVGWGLEDNDFNFRLQFSGVKCQFADNIVSHQWHLPPQPSEETKCGPYYHARQIAIKNGTDSVVANAGKDWGDPNS